MAKKLMMGNQALAYGALKAGVKVVSGYPGTPSTEVLETIAKEAPEDVYVEWSANEKCAIEVAAGASYSGKRTLVTMKQVGLNAGTDPLMSLEYIGVLGGMVLVVADDPGPISSQTEQDTRTFGMYSNVPVFDPATPTEAYIMIQDAFAISEILQTPVIVRPTTRVCHSCENVDTDDYENVRNPQNPGFRKGSRWVIFPKASYQSHLNINERNALLEEQFSMYPLNVAFGEGRKGIVSGGVSFNYAKDAVSALKWSCRFFKVSTPFPFPDKAAREFLESVDEVLVFEELDPYIERELLRIVGQYHLKTVIRGKLTKDTTLAGENTVSVMMKQISKVFDVPMPEGASERPEAPALPVRQPSLCAGCPHRASFFAVKQAMKGQDAVFCGDIGCYTLGNAQPLNMVDTCLCMGAASTVAQGIYHADGDKHKYFSYIGDSTFFHTGITSLVNAVYNQTPLTAIILDNHTTAMTGQQPHPGTGRNARGQVAPQLDITKVLEGIGIKDVPTVDPYDHKKAVETVREVSSRPGVNAIIFSAPCIALAKSKKTMMVNKDKCIGCGRCVRELGCPAISMQDGKAVIDQSLCTGCGLCSNLCSQNAMEEGTK
jgi:indolepyruvate ferredoxin oxidoreductase alpha subunit